MKLLAVALLCCAATLAAAARAQPAIVEWDDAAPASPVKLTPEQEDAARRTGRALPVPERLQPALDAALPAYVPPAGPISGTLRLAVSDTLPDLARRWVAAFRQRHPRVQFTIEPTYDGAFAAAALATDRVDIALVSRSLKPEESAAFKERHGIAPSSVPVAAGSWRHFGYADALGVIVHRDNPLSRITYRQLDAIYSSTRWRGGSPASIWGDMGAMGTVGGWAQAPIHAWGIKPWDGFEDLLRQNVLSAGGKRGEWNVQVQHESVFNMARRIAADRHAIGYTGLAYVDASVKLLAICETDAGPCNGPSYDAVAAGRYPFARTVFLNTDLSRGRPAASLVRAFVKFVRSREGQQVLLDQAIFLPLTAAAVKATDPD